MRWRHSKEKTRDISAARTLYHAWKYLQFFDWNASEFLRPKTFAVTRKFRTAHKHRCKFCEWLRVITRDRTERKMEEARRMYADPS